MKKFILSFLISFMVAATAHAASLKETAFDRIMRTHTIRCGYATWPPYLVKEPNTGKLSGLSYDYMEEIGRILDLKIDWAEEVDWGSYIEGLNTGRFDLMCMGDWAIGERLKYSGLTIPMAYSPLYIWAKTGNMKFDNNIEALNNPVVRLAVIEGDTSQNVTRLHFPLAKTDALPQTADGAQLLMDVATGKADAAIVDESMADNFMKHNPNSIHRVLSTGPVQVIPDVFVYKEGEQHLGDMLNNAILLINNTDFEHVLIRKYKVASFPPQHTYDDMNGEKSVKGH